MPWAGFEPTIPAFERANSVQALDRAATAIGLVYVQLYENPNVYLPRHWFLIYNDVCTTVSLTVILQPWT
jgi:hypothetical protein